MSKGDETRAAILEAASAAAAKGGLRGLTIGSLAAATQLSKSGLFAHFRSKETLQIAVVDKARNDYIDLVMRPTLKAPRGEPRLRELFHNWIDWDNRPGGCLFAAASSELDDEPGPVRDELARGERDWLDSIAQIVHGGVREGQFDADLDVDQFAYEMHGILLSYHHAHRLLDDPQARRRAELAMERLIAAARAPLVALTH